MKKHTENRLEDAIEYQLIEQDKYLKGDSADYDADKALEPNRFIAFVKETQAKTWQSLENIHGDATTEVVLSDLAKHLDSSGMLNVLRNGFKCYGKRIQAAYFLPNNHINDDTVALYGKNQLSVTRQLYFSSNDNKSLDMVLFLNGLPIITIE